MPAKDTSSVTSGAEAPRVEPGGLLVRALSRRPALITSWKMRLPLSLMGSCSELATCSLRWPSSPW
ncbi:hypothetical protein D9M71_636300 [compost metagenome]